MIKKPVYLLLFLLILGALALAACSSGGSSKGNEKETEASGNPPVPAQYASMKNPNQTSDQAAVTAGKAIYAANCATCHGDTGKGDGPGGASLDPKPADLTQLDTSEDTDGYLYWHIAEGGAPFKSAMPAFKDTISQEQIWQVVTYLRSISK